MLNKCYNFVINDKDFDISPINPASNIFGILIDMTYFAMVKTGFVKEKHIKDVTDLKSNRTDEANA
jgi:hypothetical protein